MDEVSKRYSLLNSVYKKLFIRSYLHSIIILVELLKRKHKTSGRVLVFRGEDIFRVPRHVRKSRRYQVIRVQ